MTANPVLTPTTNCDVAKTRYFFSFKLHKMWSFYLFGLAIFLALFLVLAVLLFLFTSSWSMRALSVLGTIVDGSFVSWASKQRKIAVDEEKTSFTDLVKYCAPPALAATAATATAAPAPQALTWAEQQPWFAELQIAAFQHLFPSSISHFFGNLVLSR